MVTCYYQQLRARCSDRGEGVLTHSNLGLGWIGSVVYIASDDHEIDFPLLYECWDFPDEYDPLSGQQGHATHPKPDMPVGRVQYPHARQDIPRH